MNPTRHPDALELQALHDGELPRGDAERLAAHCAGCERCGAALAELQAVDALLEAAPAPALPRTVWHRVDAARRSDAESLSPAFKLALAAACAAGLLLGLRFGPVKLRADAAPDTGSAGLESIWGGATDASLLSIYSTATSQEG